MSRSRFKNLRILVVEDQFLVACDLVDILSITGAEVIGPAASQDIGLRLAKNGKVDVAILDVNLGQEDVYVLAEVLRNQGIPIIFVTGYDRDHLPFKFRTTEHLKKPFNVEQLFMAIDHLVYQRKGEVHERTA